MTFPFSFTFAIMNSISVQSIDIKDLMLKRQHNETLSIVDTRSATSFLEGFIPGTIFISLHNDFENIASQILSKKEEIILLAEAGKEKESVERLIAAGFEQVTGFLSGGLDSWKKNNWANDIVIEIEADELMMDIPFDDNLMIIDVRDEEAYDADHFEGAENLPLVKLTDPGTMSMIEDHHNVYILSQTGYKSLIAASLLKRQGIHNIRTVQGGWNEVKKQML
jgi:hydroxyacylglutathione hydrolase